MKISEYVARSEYRSVGRHGRGNLCEDFFLFLFLLANSLLDLPASSVKLRHTTLKEGGKRLRITVRLMPLFSGPNRF